jgi:lipid II:glycine glycyltransferase (peptidoglycan interpeptide bridge formation enzyme)
MTPEEELNAVKQEIGQLYEKLLKAKKTFKKNPNDTDAEIEIEQFEMQITKLEQQRKDWFELVKDVKKAGIY